MTAAPTADVDRTALVVDDEQSVRLVLRRFLSRVGWSVIEAESAEQALALLNRSATPDLVICDLNMPGMSGAALFLRIAGQHPLLGSRVVLTSGDVASAERELQRAGLRCPILGKPFSLDDLARVVDSVACIA